LLLANKRNFKTPITPEQDEALLNGEKRFYGQNNIVYEIKRNKVKDNLFSGIKLIYSCSQFI
jgi:hypothetical protein